MSPPVARTVAPHQIDITDAGCRAFAVAFRSGAAIPAASAVVFAPASPGAHRLSAAACFADCLPIRHKDDGLSLRRGREMRHSAWGRTCGRISHTAPDANHRRRPGRHRVGCAAAATAVTRFALSGCSEAEIATFTGHSLKDVGALLDAHSLSRDSRMAESALLKRETHEAGTKVPNQAPNCPKPFRVEHGVRC